MSQNNKPLVSQVWSGFISRTEEIAGKQYVILELYAIADSEGYEELPVPLNWFKEEPVIGSAITYKNIIEGEQNEPY